MGFNKYCPTKTCCCHPHHRHGLTLTAIHKIVRIKFFFKQFHPSHGGHGPRLGIAVLVLLLLLVVVVVVVVADHAVAFEG